MKKLFAGLTVLLTVLMMSVSAHAYARDGYAVVAEADFDGLRIVSYSQKWDAAGIASLYAELLRNVHGDELALLARIDLYPDSPEGVAGLYFEDIAYRADGTLAIGAGAYIELFHMDRYSTAAEIAPVLAHEYGHHYTIVNIALAEGLHTSAWGQSRYAALRNLAAYPVAYTADGDYTWDVAEIAANDYVQLLGSTNARRSYDYPDAAEKLAMGDEYRLPPTMFNKRPQDNAALPLATEMNGLYGYLLEIGGYTAAAPSIDKRPVIEGIDMQMSPWDPQYTLTWTAAEGNGSFEYTAVMFPAAYPFLIEPLKTVADGEALSAVFGTVMMEDGEGAPVAAAMNHYVGDYVIVVYAQDANGFMFASEPMQYTFGEAGAALWTAEADEAENAAAGTDDAADVTDAADNAEVLTLALMNNERDVTENFAMQAMNVQTSLQVPFDSSDIDSRINCDRKAVVLPPIPILMQTVQVAGAYAEPRRVAIRQLYMARPTVQLSNSAYGGRRNGFRLSYSYGEERRF